MTRLFALCFALAGGGETRPLRWWWETHYYDLDLDVDYRIRSGPCHVAEYGCYWQDRPWRPPRPSEHRGGIGCDADRWIEYVETDRRIHDRAHTERLRHRKRRSPQAALF